MTNSTVALSTSTPAESLVGLELENGWRVLERFERADDATGGQFSVGYLVEDAKGRRGFLKALNFSLILLTAQDPLAAMTHVSGLFEHERRLLNACKQRRLSRVVTPIAEGVAEVDLAVPGGRVNYFIFELANGDARKHLAGSDPVDIAWKLRSLHHIATALVQLHRHDTAHQDVKPSNVLDYGEDGSKLGDLGRASVSDIVAPHDELSVPGDRTYAPPELLYNEVDRDWSRRRYGCDAYLLGGLVVCFFTSISMTAWTQQLLDEPLRWYKWGGDYRAVLPHVRDAYARRFSEFRLLLTSISQSLADELTPIVQQLCEPDPFLRGDPRNRGTVVSQYSLERYVSYLNRTARRAELRLL